MRSSLEQHRILLQVNNAIFHERTRNGLFNKIAKTLEPVFHFDRIDILINQPGEESWYIFSPARGVPIPGYPPDRFIVPRNKNPFPNMAEKKVLIADIGKGPEYIESRFLLEAGLLWVVRAPLIIRETIIGLLQFDYKKKPSYSEEDITFCEQVAQQVTLAIDNMLAYEQLEQLNDHLTQEKRYLKKTVAALSEPDDVIYESQEMDKVINDIRNVAPTDSTVLITGETGSGKDLIARNIHKRSARSKSDFIKLNCAALVPTLVESELFGHEKGAFTGATFRKTGRFELADNGTLFLDEISELSFTAQAKLLQVLQEGTFERVGGSQTVRTNARIIAATNQDIKHMVAEKKFREDLYYRLNVFPIHIPPLRQRREDILVLGRYFGTQCCMKLNRIHPTMTQDAVEAMVQYDWPGNVRELQNFVERIIILKSNQTVTGKDIRAILNPGEQGKSVMLLEQVEKKHIENVLNWTRGMIAGPQGAASLLGLKRGTLQYRMKKLGIMPADFKP